MKKDLMTAFDTRQYMVSNDFELYYYCDTDAKARTGLHTHDYIELYFFLEGNATAQVRDRKYKLQYGDMMIIPPHVSHGITIQNFDVPYRRFDFWISTEYYHHLVAISSDFDFALSHVKSIQEYLFHNDRIAFNTLLAKLFDLIEEQKSQYFGRETRISIDVSDLMLSINRTVYERQEGNQPSEASLYQNICSYIEQHIDEDLSLENIAGHFYLSKFYIAHVFKDSIGISIHQYIRKKRLQLCHEAILGNRSITDVYQAFGFEDYSSFYRAFKKEYGLSPKELQKRSLRDAVQSAPTLPVATREVSTGDSQTEDESEEEEV